MTKAELKRLTSGALSAARGEGLPAHDLALCDIWRVTSKPAGSNPSADSSSVID